MNESQGSSLAARRSPARGAVLGACALSAVMALAACGQKGPLFLPAQQGVAAGAASGVPLAPVQGASSPGLPPAAR
jgi:predicted small lipoprotein YifL